MSSGKINRPATTDERMGMTWWNGLTVAERREWFTSGATTAAEAWAMFKSGKNAREDEE